MSYPYPQPVTSLTTFIAPSSLPVGASFTTPDSSLGWGSNGPPISPRDESGVVNEAPTAGEALVSAMKMVRAVTPELNKFLTTIQCDNLSLPIQAKKVVSQSVCKFIHLRKIWCHQYNG